MASFTPLEVSEDLNSAIANPASLRRQPGARPVGIVIDKSCRVYITQIPVERIEREGANALRAEFEAFGPVESYKMFTEKSGRFIGSALCTYRNPADAANAIANLNGQVVDSSVIKVEIARDHGVLLLHQERRHDGAGGRGASHHGFLPTRLVDDSAITSGPDSGRWHHDRYQLIAEGKDMDEVLGINSGRRGGRGGRNGRGGYMTRGERIESAFEKYIAERDALIEKSKQNEFGEETQKAEEDTPTAGQDAASAPAAPEESAEESTSSQVPNAPIPL